MAEDTRVVAMITKSFIELKSFGNICFTGGCPHAAFSPSLRDTAH